MNRTTSILCGAAFAASLLLLPTRAAAQSGTARESKVSTQESANVAKSRLTENYGRLPLSFEPNAGQTDPRVKFLSRGPGQTLLLTSTGALLTVDGHHTLQMELLGANQHAQLSGSDELPGKSNYFLGNDPSQWHTDIPTFSRVRYSGVYPGVDLVFYGNQRQMEYDFLLAPGADPRNIRLKFSGAKRGYLDHGEAIWETNEGEMRLRKPRIYQQVDGKQVEIAGGYILRDHTIRFAIGDYDRSLALVIDPVLTYATYLGGPSIDGATGVAVDSAGNAYVTGIAGPGFPIAGGGQAGSGGSSNVFVAEISADGSTLIYSTVFGGGQDTAYAIAVDSSGGAYVTGTTVSGNFPVTGSAFQPKISLGADAFVTKLSPGGNSLAYSTFLGGQANDIAFAIAVDSAGYAYVAGETQSGDFPHTGAPNVANPVFCDPLNAGGFDGFIVKVSPDGKSLVYSLFLGGSGTDRANGVAVDGAGNAYVAGNTDSTDFLANNCPGPGIGPKALQPNNAGGIDAFVVVVNPTGTALLAATYLGTTAQDAATSIAVDGSGFIYLGGESTGGGHGTLSAYGAKLNNSLTQLDYLTYFGGSGFQEATGVAIDSSGNAYLAGSTTSTDFPTVLPFQAAYAGGTYNAFVTGLNPGGGINFSTYLSGSGGSAISTSAGDPIAVDSKGNIYVVGTTASTNFPGASSSPIQASLGGSSDAFLAKLSPGTPAAPSTTAISASVTTAVYGQPISFNITVGPTNPSSSTPSGSVTISDGSTALGTVFLVSGTAIFNSSGLAVGSHSITASYSGDGNFNVSTSPVLTIVVNQGTTALSLSASPNPGTTGQQVALTAVVTPVAPAAGVPSGYVTFFDGAQNLNTLQLVAGQATYFSSSLSTGVHSLSATYAGDGNFLGSSSSTTLAIDLTTITTLTSASPNPAITGQPVILTATVVTSPSAGTPTGSVAFLDGNTQLGTGTLVGGIATLTTSFAQAAVPHNLTASYPSTGNYKASTSASLSLTVNAGSTTTSLSVSPNPANAGQTITLTALVSTVSPATGTLSQSVTFLDGTTPINGAVMLVAGQATLMTNSLGLGPHSISASYSGDANFFASTSTTISLTIGQGPVITSNPQATFIVGTPGSFSVTASGNPGPSFTESGQLPTGLTLNPATGTISGTPAPGTAGNYSVTVTAHNGAGPDATQILALFVDQTAAITSPGQTTFMTGIAGTFSMFATGFPSPTLTVSGQLPSGVAFNPSTATLSGTPAGGTAGTYPLTITAHNGVGPDAIQNLTLTVTLIPTVITIGSATNPSLAGQSSNFTVTVTGVVGVVTGPSVLLQVNGQNFGSPVPLLFTGSPNPVGTATISIPSFAVAGTYTVTANFQPFSQYVASSSASLTQTVNPISAAMALTANFNPALTTQSVSVTATMTGTVPFVFTPLDAGNVAFQIDGGPVVNIPPQNSGSSAAVANLNIGQALSLGTHTVTATYTCASGGCVIAPSSATLTLTIYNTPTGTAVSVTPVDTIAAMAPATLVFNNVTQAGGTSLSIQSGGPAPPSGFQLGNPPVYYNLSTTALYTGGISICINYSGVSFTQPPQLFHYQNGAWTNITTSVNITTMTVCGVSPSLSPFTLFQPGSLPTATTITSPNSIYGTPGSVTVSVASSGGAAAGTVSLSVDGGAASSTILVNGSATFNLGILAAGTHSLSASFPAQGNFLGSIFSGTLTVVPETTSLSVTFSPASIMVGQSTTATITLAAPDMTVPIDPSALAPITLTSPVASDILSTNGVCTPVPSMTPGVASCAITVTSVEPNGRTLNVSFPGSANLVASSGTADLIVTAALQSQQACIASDFRNVAVPGGSYVWFNSIFKVRDVTKQLIHISFFQSSVQFQYTDPAGNSVTVNQALPDAKITIDPNATVASTSFDPINNVWITTIPWDLDDNSFLTGMPWLVPSAGLPADVEPVTMCGTFASDVASVDIGWRWAAAAYSSFSSDNTTLGVKPMDTDHDNQATNHDHAGTPENYNQFVIPGARGKGGKNYTGTYSRSAVIE